MTVCFRGTKCCRGAEHLSPDTPACSQAWLELSWGHSSCMLGTQVPGWPLRRLLSLWPGLSQCGWNFPD